MTTPSESVNVPQPSGSDASQAQQPDTQRPEVPQVAPQTGAPQAAAPQSAAPQETPSSTHTAQQATGAITQPEHPTQPTTPLPEAPVTSGGAVPPYYGAPTPQNAFGMPAPQTPQTPQPPQAQHIPSSAAASSQKSRAGMLIAGIAIGAVVGGVVGGGASALVMANQPAAIIQPSPGGTITLNNPDTATVVSGVAAAATPSVVTLEVSSRTAAGSGSGVIYSEDGYIVTNAHVVTLDGQAGTDPEIRVWLSDGRILDGTLVGTDPFADLAVVKVEAENLVPVPLADADDIHVGDLTVAIGAPLNLSNTVTSGVVSALHRGISVGSPIIPEQQDEVPDDEPNQDEGFPWFRFGNPNEAPERQQQAPTGATRVTLPVIQTDASINPGNSGGALLNANAELIGINVAIASNGADASTAGSDGLGFAIPVNMVTRVADSIIAGERPSHGLLGISIGDSTADTDEDRNVAGGLVTDVNRGGAAEEAGLRVGDVITGVNGIPADSGTTVSALIRMHEGGDEVTIDYSRGGVPGQITVTLGTLEW